MLCCLCLPVSENTCSMYFVYFLGVYSGRISLVPFYGPRACAFESDRLVSGSDSAFARCVP